MADLRPGGGGRAVLRPGGGVKGMEDFFERVLSQMKGATRREKQALRRELEDHVADRAGALVENGCPEEEARGRALEAMGDPERIGRELGKVYSHFWLVASRIMSVVLAVVLVVSLTEVPVGRIRESLMARRTPEQAGQIGTGKKYIWDEEQKKLVWEHEGKEAIAWDPGLKAEIGNDILSVYQVVLYPACGCVEVYWCNYDKSVLGLPAEDIMPYITVTNQAGEKSRAGSGGTTRQGGRSGAGYYNARDLTAAPGDQYVCLTYDRYGRHLRLEIPLRWEGEP